MYTIKITPFFNDVVEYCNAIISNENKLNVGDFID